MDRTHHRLPFLSTLSGKHAGPKACYTARNAELRQIFSHVTSKSHTKLTVGGASSLQIPFPAALAWLSTSLFFASSSLTPSRSLPLLSLIFAHPLRRISSAKSAGTPPIWISAAPRSRSVPSSPAGSECKEVNEISLPTRRARRNSRDSKAQGCRVRR